MKKIFKSILLKKLISKFGIYFNDIDIHGLKFNNVKYSSLTDFYFNQNLEIETFKLLKHSNYDTFIDLGAYFGYFSIYAKNKANIKNVFAYEASSYNFNQLKKFAELNNAEVNVSIKLWVKKRALLNFTNQFITKAKNFLLTDK